MGEWDCRIMAPGDLDLLSLLSIVTRAYNVVRMETKRDLDGDWLILWDGTRKKEE